MKSVTALYCLNEKPLFIELCWQYPCKISKLGGVWLDATRMTQRERERERVRPSPMFHLSFPGCTADKSSSMTWMWPDCLDGDASPAGALTKEFHRRVHMMSSSPDTVSQLRNPPGFKSDRRMSYYCFTAPYLAKARLPFSFSHRCQGDSFF